MTATQGPPPPGRFSLDKWYLDAVGESGEVFIGYSATLGWRGLHVSYASTLTGGAGEPRTRSTVRSEEEPILRNGSLAWTSSALGVKGSWRDGAAPGISRTLYESPEGAVVWNCVLPAARCELAHEGRSLRGPGYAERLSLTLPPWTLPIDTLRWGRFLTEAHSVVWIDWRTKDGPPRTWIFVDGAEVRGETSEETVSFEGGRLRLPLESRLLLRAGRLSYLLRNLPFSRSLRTSPLRRALAMHETKWRTRGCLELDGEAPSPGWAIHEIVRFGS